MLVRTFCVDIGTSTILDGLAACQSCCAHSLQSCNSALQVDDYLKLRIRLQQAPAVQASPFLSCRTSVISMSLKTGIVGLPNVGKVRQPLCSSDLHAAEPVLSLVCQCAHCGLSALLMRECAVQSTLFNAICENGKAQAANFPFCTIEPNVGIVAVPDPRLQVCLISRLQGADLHHFAPLCSSMLPCRTFSHESTNNGLYLSPQSAQLVMGVTMRYARSNEYALRKAPAVRRR